VTKIKIKAYNPDLASIKPNNGGKASQQPPPAQMPERKQSFISKCVGIIKEDIREVIHGEEGIKMPESKESWKDWEGEI